MLTLVITPFHLMAQRELLSLLKRRKERKQCKGILAKEHFAAHEVRNSDETLGLEFPFFWSLKLSLKFKIGRQTRAYHCNRLSVFVCMCERKYRNRNIPIKLCLHSIFKSFFLDWHGSVSINV